ncbi:MAG: hypothetical protein K5878_02050 [Rhizobiaceae bacterium]|nr:hypothetical protein [Rhizobiaceae bacterium]
MSAFNSPKRIQAHSVFGPVALHPEEGHMRLFAPRDVADLKDGLVLQSGAYAHHPDMHRVF